MLIRIGTQPRSAPRDAVAALLACHDRIRTFSELAVRLATATGKALPDELTDAAARVERYFAIALPLHVRDEEESVRPRVVAVSTDVAVAVAAMTAEHVTIDELLESLLPRWGAIARDATAIERGRAKLYADTVRLRELFDAHLDGEERVVFPALRTLPGAALDAIAAELRERRRAAPGTDANDPP